MKNYFYLIPCLIIVIACQNKSSDDTINFNEEMLLHNLKVISHDSMQGRFFGTKGNYKAQKFIANQFKSLGIESAFPNSSIQKFLYTFSGQRRQEMYPIPNLTEDFSNVPDTTIIGGNVVTMIKGKIKNAIIITAHFDHLGIKGDQIYNGADDNSSGTAALITIADYFKNKSLKHTLIFAAVDAEEIGSLGCEYLLNNFPIDLENVVLNINIDMIAHNDSMQLYASGLYHYPDLKEPLDEIKSNINLLYGHDNPNNKGNKDIKVFNDWNFTEDWTLASDHREFHKRNIPFIFFGVEEHKDYHKPSDTFENINSDFYQEVVKLVIQAIEGYDTFLTINN